MTSTPNNIAGEEWEKEFDAADLDALFHDPDRALDPVRVKAFISKTRQEGYNEGYRKGQSEARAHYYERVRQEAIAGERKEFMKWLTNMNTCSDTAMRIRLGETIEHYKALTPNPDTSTKK